MIQEHEQLVRDILHVSDIAYFDNHEETPAEYQITMLMDIKLWVKGEKQVNRREVIMDLEKKVADEEQFLQRIRLSLSSNDFVSKAPPEVVAEKKQKMEEVKSKIAQMQYEINKLRMEHK